MKTPTEIKYQIKIFESELREFDGCSQLEYFENQTRIIQLRAKIQILTWVLNEQ